MRLREIQIRPRGPSLYIAGLFILATLALATWLAYRVDLPEAGPWILIVGAPATLASLLGYRHSCRARERDIGSRPADFPDWLRDIATGDWVGHLQVRIIPNGAQLVPRRLVGKNILIAFSLLLPAFAFGQLLSDTLRHVLGFTPGSAVSSLCVLAAALRLLATRLERKVRRSVFTIDRARGVVQTSAVGPYRAHEFPIESVRGLYVEASPGWTGVGQQIHEFIAKTTTAAPMIALAGEGPLSAPICEPVDRTAALTIAKWVSARVGAPLLGDVEAGDLPCSEPPTQARGANRPPSSGRPRRRDIVDGWRPVAVNAAERPSLLEAEIFRRSWIVLAVLVPVGAAIHAGHLIHQQLATDSFLPAPAVMRECRLARDGKTSTLHVGYGYSVGEQSPPLYGTVISRSLDSVRRGAFVERFPPGTQFTAYYDPADPRSAVMFRGESGLQPSERGRFYVLIALSALAALGLLSQAFARLRNNRAGGWEAYWQANAMTLRESEVSAFGRAAAMASGVVGAVVAYIGHGLPHDAALYVLAGGGWVFAVIVHGVTNAVGAMSVAVDSDAGVAEFGGRRPTSVPLANIREVRVEGADDAGSPRRAARVVVIYSVDGREEALSVTPAGWGGADRLRAATQLARTLGAPMRFV